MFLNFLSAIRYVWGIWFQVVYVICKLGLIKDYRDTITFTLNELKRCGYFANFTAEMGYDEYTIMREIIETIG